MKKDNNKVSKSIMTGLVKALEDSKPKDVSTEQSNETADDNSANSPFEDRFNVKRMLLFDEEFNGKYSERYFYYINDAGEEEKVALKATYNGEARVGILFPISPIENVYFEDGDYSKELYLIRKAFVDEDEGLDLFDSESGPCRAYVTPLNEWDMYKVAGKWLLESFLRPLIEEYSFEHKISERINYQVVVERILDSLTKQANEYDGGNEQINSFLETLLNGQK